MKSKQYQTAVNHIERVLHEKKLSCEEILCVLAKVTANAIHVIEDRRLRTRVELEYISALRTFSAQEEKGQVYLKGEAPKYHDVFVTKMMRVVSSKLLTVWDT